MSSRPQAEYVDTIRRELRLVRILGEPVVVSKWLIASNVLVWVIALSTASSG